MTVEFEKILQSDPIFTPGRTEALEPTNTLSPIFTLPKTAAPFARKTILS